MLFLFFVVAFSEGLLVGYRWYDAKQQVPLFPFGHGLSYTTFLYSGVSVKNIGANLWAVNVNVTNNGKMAGREVVQVCLGSCTLTHISTHAHTSTSGVCAQFWRKLVESYCLCDAQQIPL